MPLDQRGNDVPTHEELVERVVKLEQNRAVSLEELPLADLKRKLESSWQPDASILLEAGSIRSEQLAAGAAVRPRDARGLVLHAGNEVRAVPVGESLHTFDTGLALVAFVGNASNSIASTWVTQKSNILSGGTGFIYVSTNAAQNAAFTWIAVGLPT